MQVTKTPIIKTNSHQNTNSQYQWSPKQINQKNYCLTLTCSRLSTHEMTSIDQIKICMSCQILYKWTRFFFFFSREYILHMGISFEKESDYFNSYIEIWDYHLLQFLKKILWCYRRVWLHDRTNKITSTADEVKRKDKNC